MELSKTLKKRREELGLRVKDVAKEIGVAESTYREWENGRKIQGEPYIDIANVLGITTSELLGINKKEAVQAFLLEIELLEKHVKNIKRHVSLLF